MMIIGEQLRDARQQHQLSQEQIAELLGVSRQTISNWETSRSYPDIERMMRLAEIYHLSLDELLRGDQQMVKTWMAATNVVRIGKWLGFLLALNVVLAVALMFVVQVPWLMILLFGAMVVCVCGAFYLLLRLI
ncbi:helix-turn-helix domain-containing protein [Lacticaseibacillus porcinae]|uniref:helix-turn-helix domain-containing protein n=1 Tax=Lacticaseibacillus porcinae TaxID=1123687 RepID=UPI001CDC87DC|nr:helix-turn-helix transcriptional regulator [Lacticaseibacillus porcinae]